MEFEIGDRRGDRGAGAGEVHHSPKNPSKSNVDPEEYAEEHDQAVHIPEQEDG